VTAAPSSEESITLLNALPKVVPKPLSKASAENFPYVFVRLSDSKTILSGN
jgi:hypothetical protein